MTLAERRTAAVTLTMPAYVRANVATLIRSEMKRCPVDEAQPEDRWTRVLAEMLAIFEDPEG